MHNKKLWDKEAVFSHYNVQCNAWVLHWFWATVVVMQAMWKKVAIDILYWYKVDVFKTNESYFVTSGEVADLRTEVGRFDLSLFWQIIQISNFAKLIISVQIVVSWELKKFKCSNFGQVVSWECCQPRLWPASQLGRDLGQNDGERKICQILIRIQYPWVWRRRRRRTDLGGILVVRLTAGDLIYCRWVQMQIFSGCLVTSSCPSLCTRSVLIWYCWKCQ